MTPTRARAALLLSLVGCAATHAAPAAPAASDTVPTAAKIAAIRTHFRASVAARNAAVIAEVRARFQAAIVARDAAAMRGLMLADDVPFRARNAATGALFASTAGAFAADVGAATTAWREDFEHEVITARDGLAVLDADYRFVEDGRVTNHGREIWTLMLTADGWKITSVTWSVIVD